jgi:crossover junction endonuclease MUS81
MVKLIIDVRERGLIPLLTDVDGIEIETAALEIGDIKMVGEATELLFERKSFADLAASIKDNRFREQKTRILSVYPADRVTYIVEGAPSFKAMRAAANNNTSFHGMLPSAFMSALISLQLRDGFNLVYTDSVEDTAAYLREVVQRLAKSPEKVVNAVSGSQGGGGSGNAEDYVSTLKTKTKKSANITPDVCYILQLAQIPGLSAKIAKDIAKVYPTMFALLTALSAEEKPQRLLSSIDGIGAKRAARIVEFLLP